MKWDSFCDLMVHRLHLQNYTAYLSPLASLAREEGKGMPVQLFSHNRQVHDAMSAEASKAAVIQPAGTGRRFAGLSPRECIYNAQIENVTRTEPDSPAGRITFLAYTRSILMEDEKVAALALL